MKPHVLIISPALAKGGMERQLSLFLQYYDRSKLQVTLAVLEDDIRYNLPSDTNLIELNRKYARDPGFYWRLWKQLRSTNYHVVNSKISGVNELVLLLCGFLNKSDVIAEVRNTGKMLYSYHKRMSRLFQFFRKDWWVVCNSRTAQREVIEILPEEATVLFVGNGIDTNYFSPVSSSRTKKDIKLAYAGRIAPQKNLEVLISALPYVIDAEMACSLVIQGPATNKEYIERLKNTAEILGVTNRVEFISSQERSVRELYHLADVFILPSLFEGTPNALLEAMSCQCVCLSSKSANTDNFLSSDFTFNENDPEELAEKIVMLSKQSQKEKAEIGRKNRQYVLENYSVSQMVGKMTQVIYDKLGLS